MGLEDDDRSDAETARGWARSGLTALALLAVASIWGTPASLPAVFAAGLILGSAWNGAGRPVGAVLRRALSATRSLRLPGPRGALARAATAEDLDTSWQAEVERSRRIARIGPAACVAAAALCVVAMVPGIEWLNSMRFWGPEAVLAHEGALTAVALVPMLGVTMTLLLAGAVEWLRLEDGMTARRLAPALEHVHAHLAGTGPGGAFTFRRVRGALLMELPLPDAARPLVVRPRPVERGRVTPWAPELGAHADVSWVGDTDRPSWWVASRFADGEAATHLVPLLARGGRVEDGALVMSLRVVDPELSEHLRDIRDRWQALHALITARSRRGDDEVVVDAARATHDEPWRLRVLQAALDDPATDRTRLATLWCTRLKGPSRLEAADELGPQARSPLLWRVLADAAEDPVLRSRALQRGIRDAAGEVVPARARQWMAELLAHEGGHVLNALSEVATGDVTLGVAIAPVLADTAPPEHRVEAIRVMLSTGGFHHEDGEEATLTLLTALAADRRIEDIGPLATLHAPPGRVGRALRSARSTLDEALASRTGALSSLSGPERGQMSMAHDAARAGRLTFADPPKAR